MALSLTDDDSKPASSIHIVVADDHPVFRQGLSTMLDDTDGLAVVGQASTGREALQLVDEREPDVLLLDIEMPEGSGVEVAQYLHEEDTDVRVLALSSYDDPEYAANLLASGAAGYITKENAPDLIIEAVRAVYRGEVRWFVQPAPSPPPGGELTKQEKKVVRLLARGLTNAELAEQLSVSESTVRTHLRRVFDKLDVETARAAVSWAWQSGLMGRR
jgi:DNA-binding NarL/FixJ family response regulator